MRKFLMSAAIVGLLAACSPPSAPNADDTTPPPGPTVVACNDVAPDAGRQVSLGNEVAVAAAASDLRGGAIAPGTYDLVSGSRLGNAPGWSGARAVALDAREDAAGAVTFNWASAGASGETERWTASFTDTPAPHLAFSCGRSGETSDVDFSANANALTLRLPDASGTGALRLDFQRRS